MCLANFDKILIYANAYMTGLIAKNNITLDFILNYTDLLYIN